MASRSLPMSQFPVTTRSYPDSIPLKCNICAKKPTFSDVSHLLTHIASKGHLSTYYKIKVRAGQEEESRQLIEAYDTWYATWNIEYLMSERMNLKDQKRPRARPSSKDASSRSASTAPQRRSYSIDQPMDPRLVSSGIKAEPVSRMATPYIDPASLHNPYSFPIQSWFTMPYGYSTVPIKQEPYDYADVPVPSSEYSPTPSRASRPSRDQVSTSYIATEDYDLDYGLENDSNKLKGVLWPGMNMFDAATPEMRRKRNQKKAISVLEQLEATSKDIDATELVFSPSGTLRRARHISGFPNPDSSPLKGEEPPLPKIEKKPTRRPALTEKDPNTSRRPKRKAKQRRTPYYGSNESVADEEELDGALTYVPPRIKPRKKRKMQVYQDEDVEDGDDSSVKHVKTGQGSPEIANHATWTKPSRSHVTASAAQFRPVDTSNFGGYGYGESHGRYGNENTTDLSLLDRNMLPAWDFLGQDLGAPYANPLYTGTYPAGLGDEDDQETISALTSEDSSSKIS